MGEPTTEELHADAASAPAVKLQSLDFTSNHHLLKGCKEDIGWRNAGAPCPAPEWTPNAASPVSLTMDQPLAVRLSVNVTGGDPRALPVTIHGLAPAGLGVVRPNLGTGSGASSFVGASSGKLEKKIQKLDLTIQWKAGSSNGTGAGGLVSPESTSNIAYVTMGTPRDDQQREWEEDGVTLKRMDRAVAWIGALDTLDPHRIVGDLMAKFPNYTLQPSPRVPRKYHHPTYYNEEGGAWAMSDFVEETGECQAIVRLVRGMTRQLGMPGETRVIVVWSEPDVGGGRTGLSADLEAQPSAGLDVTREVNGRRWIAALVDGPVKEGKTYPASHTTYRDGTVSPGLNRYEACLAFTQGGKTLYYAGGAGVNAVFESTQPILELFWGLIWVSAASNDGFRVEKIVARYRNEGGVA